MVPIDTYYALLERAAENDDALPIRYAESVSPEDFGLMGLAVKTAAHVRDGLQRMSRYILVLSNSLDYSLEDHPQGAAFLLQNRPHSRRGACLANEGALAAVLSLLRQGTAAAIVPSQVTFQHPQPTDIEAHRRFFGAPVEFNAPQDALHFDRTSLQRPMRLSDEGLSTFLLSHLEDWRTEVVDRSLVANVRRAVTGSLCDGPPKQAHIAQQLGMSERTLHRKLADHGVSFRALTDDARRHLAESLLANAGPTLAEIAFLTGFSEQSAFQRAFKRWSGQTPSAYRQQRQGPSRTLD